MAAGRSLGIVAILLALVPVARAQTYPLTEAVNVDDCFRINIDMSLTGEMRVTSRLNEDVTTAFPIAEAVPRLEPGVYVLAAFA